MRQHVKGQIYGLHSIHFVRQLNLDGPCFFLHRTLTYLLWWTQSAVDNLFITSKTKSIWVCHPKWCHKKTLVCLVSVCHFSWDFWKPFSSPCEDLPQERSKEIPTRRIQIGLRFWSLGGSFLFPLWRLVGQKWNNMKILQVFSKQTEFHRAWKRIFYRTLYLQVLFWSSRGLLDNDEPH